MSFARVFLAGALALMLLPAEAGAAGGNTFSPGYAGFSIRFKEEVCPYRVMAAFVLPGEKLALASVDGGAIGCRTVIPVGRLSRRKAHSWRYIAPVRPGLYPVEITHKATGRLMTVNVFVMVPAKKVKRGILNGYNIGRYPPVPEDKPPIYSPPRGFVEVTPALREARVSPHFTLGQFLCKAEYCSLNPYLVLRERLLLKLERVLEEVNARGRRAATFTIMSGYRTPEYNTALGNSRYSRHLWGCAADIFVDERPADGVMDDLNRDGTTDLKDAAVLYEIVDSLYGAEENTPMVGGLARYPENEYHGPFVHVDVRGFSARWGD